MKFILIFVVITAAAASVVNSIPMEKKVVHYNGYQVIRTFPTTLEQYEALHQLGKQDFDFWSELRKGHPTDIMVGPNQMNEFKTYLLKFNILYEIFIPDVQKIISEQKEASLKRGKQSEFDWEDYHSTEVIHSFLNQLAKEHPNLVTLKIIGKSYQGRDIPLVKISTGGTGKRGVFMHGNIHAREWISPAVVTYIINEFAIKPNEYKNVLSLYDFYIVPNVNPDGYEWSRYWDRMWRKTMSHHNSSIGCFGVDADRNWGYNWGGPGASTEKCSLLYMGPVQFSESENDAIQKFIFNTPVDWTYFLTIHSYGQYCLLPFGDGTRPIDYDELLKKGNIYANAVFGMTGTIYTVGNSHDILYQTSGTSSDWAKGTAHIKYSYKLELRDLGTYGFLLPPDQIIPTAKETLTGIIAMLIS